MIISMCVPIMNRLEDFKITFPAMARAAQASPPAEVAVMDYGSTDGLEAYMRNWWMREGYTLTYRRLMHEHYHVAHARNLSTLISRGEWFICLSADSLVTERLVSEVRRRIEQHQPDWMSADKLGGIIACKRELFERLGGYDERIELYGPEDKDFAERLTRYGAKRCGMPHEVEILPTPDRMKVENFRVRGTKTQLSKKARWVLEENQRDEVIVANAGRGWGQWI